MKNLLKSCGLFLLITGAMMTLTVPAFAQDFSEFLKPIGEQTNLPGFEAAHFEASVEPGATSITSAILYTVDLLKYLLGSIAVIIIIAAGVRLITAGKNIDDIAPKMKDNIKYALIGLVVIFMADVMVKTVFFGEYGEVFKSESDIKLAAEAGAEQIRGLYNFLQIFVASLAILFIIFSAFRLIIQAHNEEVLTKTKKHLIWAVAGLMLVGVSELIVKDIIFPQQGDRLPDVARAIQLIVSITNFVSGFVATVCVTMLMYGGYLYVTAFGKDDQTGKAKKVIIGAIIGLIIALAAFAVVNTVIKLEPLAETAVTSNSDSHSVGLTASAISSPSPPPTPVIPSQ